MWLKFILNGQEIRLLAFPNAYISTDEPPKRSVVRTALCAVAIVGVGYFGLVMLTLSIFWTHYSPISQFASDYGVGAYGTETNAGFLLAGMGFISMALVVLFSGLGPKPRVGGVLLLLDGFLLITSGIYHTDIEGTVVTLHGQIHGFAGVMFFLTSPIGLLLVSHGLGRKRFALTLLAVVVAVAFVFADEVLALDATGLAERLVILVVFSSLILTSVRFLRRP